MAQYAPYLIGDSSSYKPIDVIAIFVGYVFFPFLFGIIFIRFGGLIARKLLPSDENAESNCDDLERSGITVLGVFLLYRALSDSALHFGTIYQANQLLKNSMAPPDITLVNPDQYGAILATAIEFAFSLWLVFGSKGLVNLLRAFRSR